MAVNVVVDQMNDVNDPSNMIVVNSTAIVFTVSLIRFNYMYRSRDTRVFHAKEIFNRYNVIANSIIIVFDFNYIAPSIIIIIIFIFYLNNILQLR